jgi:pimeloyl-ACP methyl ester carboxylesterase
MEKFREYGQGPFNVAFIHGGPGAAGELKPVAKRVSEYCPSIEPFQTAMNINGQVEELRLIIERKAPGGIILAGYSWGAWLSWIFAAKYPKLVKKIIMISSPPFTDEYAAAIMPARLSRLKHPLRQEFEFLFSNIGNKAVRDKRRLMERIGQLTQQSDFFNPDFSAAEKPEHNADIYERVWNEASAMRSSGELLKLSKSVKCHVTAIHGDYDPYPAEGVRAPLSRVKRKFTFHLLKNCGHTPWLEKEASEIFFSILKDEITA